MPRVSERDICYLADQIGIDVDEEEIAVLRKQVEVRLEEVEPLAEMLVPLNGPTEERSWRSPNEDPHNAITVRCKIESAEDAMDLLEDTTVGVKDNIAVAGVPMQCASKVMEGFVPATDATAVDRLRAAGGRITCKTNLDEFACGPQGTTARTGAVTNPHDETRIAGGSSAGSAVAVATAEVDVALGTDTGGSIRIPAALCGTVGFKPTYGLVPLDGVVENTYTADHVGPISRTVAEAARTFGVIAGRSERDPASLRAAGRPSYRSGNPLTAIRNPPAVDNLELGVLINGFGNDVTNAVSEQTMAVTEHVEDAGATVRPVSIDCFEDGRAIKNCLSFVEMAANWRDGGAPYRRGGVISEHFQTEFARRAKGASDSVNELYKIKLLSGAYLIDEPRRGLYTKAQAVREHFGAEFETTLEELDALLLPTVPDIAPPIEDAFDPGFDYAQNTRAANVARLPAITLPNGTQNGLPVGLQLVGSAFHDDHLLGTASTIAEYTEETLLT